MSTILEKANQILEEKNNKILPENLKQGVTFFDVEGSLVDLVEGTSDATVTAEDMAESKTAYVNGQKIIGTAFVVDDKFMTIADEIAKSDIEGDTDIAINSPAPVWGNNQKTLLSESARIGIWLPIEQQSRLANIAGLTPDKLLKGNTVLGIEGTAEVDSTSNIKQFFSIDEMKASSASIGDIAIVTSESVNIGSVFSSYKTIQCDEVVTLPTTHSEDIDVFFKDAQGNQFTVLLNSTSFQITYGNGVDIQVTYTSEDGITYTRTEMTGATVTDNRATFSAPFSCSEPEYWHDNIGYFMQYVNPLYDGTFKYEYQLVPNKYHALTSASVDDNYNLGYSTSIFELSETDINNINLVLEQKGHGHYHRPAILVFDETFRNVSAYYRYQTVGAPNPTDVTNPYLLISPNGTQLYVRTDMANTNVYKMSFNLDVEAGSLPETTIEELTSSESVTIGSLTHNIYATLNSTDSILAFTDGTIGTLNFSYQTSESAQTSNNLYPAHVWDDWYEMIKS